MNPRIYLIEEQDIVAVLIWVDISGCNAPD